MCRYTKYEKGEKQMILVSMIGDFDSSTMPVFFHYKDSLTKHIIINDDATSDIKRVKKILKGQEEFKRAYNLDYEIINLKIDEDSFDDIVDCYNKIMKLSPNPKELYFNGTDGLSSPVLILANRILKIGGSFISYDKHDNEYHLLTKGSMTKHKLNSLKIKDHINLKGYKILSHTKHSTLKSRKDAVIKLTKDLKRYKEFTSLIQNNSIDNIDGFDDFKILLRDIDKEKDKPYIQGGVFEEYIYWLVKKLPFDEVMTGVEVEFGDNFKNEFDILMIKNNHLHAIECKFVNSINGTHYIYKVNSLIDYLDDDGKAMVLSVGGENESFTKNGKRKVQFTKGDRSRAYYGNIQIFQTRNFVEDSFLDEVRKFFDLKDK